VPAVWPTPVSRPILKARSRGDRGLLKALIGSPPQPLDPLPSHRGEGDAPALSSPHPQPPHPLAAGSFFLVGEATENGINIRLAWRCALALYCHRMSRSRQSAEPQVRAASVAWASSFVWRNRASVWGHLLFASRGMLTVRTDAGLWVVPAHQAIWIPAGVRQEVEIAGGVAMRALYLSDSLGHLLHRRLPQSCRVVQISPLLREILRRAMRLQTLDRRIAPQRHLLDVLLDELTVLPLVPLDLPMPHDPRGARAAALIRADPAARATLADIARAAAASARTLERLFRNETGLPFGVWRQRARLLRALQLLAEGDSVAATARAVGYESPSAFVAAFRRALGVTPGRYFKRSAAGEDETEDPPPSPVAAG
jgi:AraC-like DNA-binding protein